MAHQGSFSSSHSSQGSASPSASNSSAASRAASLATVSFSVFQESAGRPLVFAPPLGTPELQSLVDLFIALDVPVSMKMEMIQRDFEAHTARTSERYKTYFVPAAAAASPAAAAASAATVPTTITSPSTFTASPGPAFHSMFDSRFSQPASVSGVSASGSGSGSGSGSMYLDASPVARPSPTESDLTIASDSFFPVPTSMFSTHFTSFHGDRPMDFSSLAGGFFPVAVDHSPVAMAAPSVSSAPSLWSATSTATSPSVLLPSPSPESARRAQQQQRQSVQPQRRRLSGSSSMQILTRSGEDVTHMSSRGTRTHEERENTRIVRQRGACPDCRRKKTRCNPDHAGSTLERVSRAGPYVAPAQSGRAKAEAAAAKAAKASKEKVEGKKAATTSDPVFLAPQGLDPAILAGIEDGGGGGSGGFIPHDVALDLNMFQDSFDWDLLSDHGRLFTSDDLELDIATTLSMTMPSTTTSTDAPAHEHTADTTFTQMGEYGVPPVRPRAPHRPTDSASLQSRRNVTTDDQPQMERLTHALDYNGGSSSVAPAIERSSLFSDLGRFSTLNASITESRVQLGASETGGSLTGSSSLPFSRPLSSRTESIGEDYLDRRRTITTTTTSPTSSRTGQPDREQDLHRTEPTERGIHLRERGRLETSEDRTSAPGHQHLSRRLPEDGQSPGLGNSQPGCGDLSPTSGLESASTSSRVLQTSSTDDESSSLRRVKSHSTTSTTATATAPVVEASPTSPVIATTILAGLAELVASLIPAYLAWTAAQPSDDLVSEMDDQFERMNLSPAMVACQ